MQCTTPIKSPRNREQCLSFWCDEAWRIEYIGLLPQTHQSKHYVFTIVEETTRGPETYPVSHTTAQNATLGLEWQILWPHGTPESTDQENGTNFQNNFINSLAKKHDID